MTEPETPEAPVVEEPTPEPSKPAPPDTDAALARMRREKEAAEKQAKDAREALAERDRKDAEEQGRWEELAKTETARREALEVSQREADQRRNAERSAGYLKFKDAGYALYLLQQDQVDLADPAAVKTALAGMAETRKDLVQGHVPPPSGGPAGGEKTDPPGLTAEQITAMTPRQLAAIEPDVIKKALGQQ